MPQGPEEAWSGPGRQMFKISPYSLLWPNNAITRSICLGEQRLLLNAQIRSKMVSHQKPNWSQKSNVCRLLIRSTVDQVLFAAWSRYAVSVLLPALIYGLITVSFISSYSALVFALIAWKSGRAAGHPGRKIGVGGVFTDRLRLRVGGCVTLVVVGCRCPRDIPCSSVERVHQ